MTTQALLSVAEARDFLLQRARTNSQKTENIHLMRARGRVLARDLVANPAVPPHDNSAMDGYAVRLADVQAGVTLPVSQRIAAGRAPQPLAVGTAARIFTGGVIPPGADAVVMQEDTTANSDSVTFNAGVSLGKNIRRAGEDVEKGTVVIPAGTRLGAAHLGLAAAIGESYVDVLAPLRVAVFFTGDELCEPGETLSVGKIYNSNRYWLRAVLEAQGCAVRDLGVVPDSLAATRLALADAAATCDVVLTCGGVSVGEEDHVKHAVEREGELALWKVAIKPGKPLAFGRVNKADFVGLPGNPVSGFVTFLTLVSPFLRKRQGLPDNTLLTAPSFYKSEFTWGKPDPLRTEFLRVKQAQNEQGETVLKLFPHQGSGVLTSMAWADGLVELAPGQSVAVGDMLPFTPFPW